MKPKVVMIHLEAVQWQMLDGWIATGTLPYLAALQRASARAKIKGVSPFLAELPQLALLTATQPQTLQTWGAFSYDVAKMQPVYARAYDFQRIRPFFDYHSDLNVCQFDLAKATLLQMAQGVQVLNWGAHGSLNDDQSNPPDLFDQIIATYGPHPAKDIEHAELWQVDKLRQLAKALLDGVSIRSRIHLDLLRRSDWDLVLFSFSEMHSLAHALLHLEGGAFQSLDQTGLAPQALILMQSIDQSLGLMMKELGPQDSIIVFASHGTDHFNWDNNTMFLLPEYLHRLQFPERRRMENAPLPPPTFGTDWWVHAAWDASFGDTRPKPAFDQGMNWVPSSWYVSDWPKMRAFALPGLDEGMIRLNIRGREPQGLVEPSDYHAELDRLERLLSGIMDARTNLPVVAGFYRTRRDPLQDGPDLPPADLIVEWSSATTDAFLCPQIGQIGPVPLRRIGGHSAEGFAWFHGPDFTPSENVAMSAMDIGPTVLDILGRALPNHFDGTSVLRHWGEAADQALFPKRPRVA